MRAFSKGMSPSGRGSILFLDGSFQRQRREVDETLYLLFNVTKGHLAMLIYLLQFNNIKSIKKRRLPDNAFTLS